MLTHHKMRVLGGMLLVSGTTIGAGMLALPVSTGLAGFLPSAALLVVYWAFMTYTAFLFLEAYLWMKNKNANLISMAEKTLGKWGAKFCWAVYLFLLYSLTTAYMAGSGPIIKDTVLTLTGQNLPPFLEYLPLLLFFGFFVYEGTGWVDYINRFLMLGLVLCFASIAFVLFPHVKIELLKTVDWKYTTFATSILATSFGFHIIIPTLSAYLKEDVLQIKKAIFIGSVIPLATYLLWEFLALGILPLDGPNGIENGYFLGASGSELLAMLFQGSGIQAFMRAFSFFAISTSFLGVSISLSDFLADGFKIKKTPGGRFVLYLLTFLPPILFTVTDPRAFLSALEYAGAFGVVVLLCLLPALMCWRGRYVLALDSSYTVFGGKPLLVLIILISLAVIVLEIVNKLHLF